MDILSIQPATATLDIIHPATGKPIGLTLTLTSTYGDQVRAADHETRNAILRGTVTPSAEANDDALRTKLAAAIVGWEWSNGLSLDGDEKPDPTTENKVKLLKRVPWISQRVQAKLADETAFFRADG